MAENPPNPALDAATVVSEKQVAFVKLRAAAQESRFGADRGPANLLGAYAAFFSDTTVAASSAGIRRVLCHTRNPFSSVSQNNAGRDDG